MIEAHLVSSQDAEATLSEKGCVAMGYTSTLFLFKFVVGWKSPRFAILG